MYERLRVLTRAFPIRLYNLAIFLFLTENRVYESVRGVYSYRTVFKIANRDSIIYKVCDKRFSLSQCPD